MYRHAAANPARVQLAGLIRAPQPRYAGSRKSSEKIKQADRTAPSEIGAPTFRSIAEIKIVDGTKMTYISMAHRFACSASRFTHSNSSGINRSPENEQSTIKCRSN